MKKPTILIADDEPIARSNIRSFLEARYDCKLQEAKDGDEAMQFVKSSPCDVIILDIKMPKKDGLETLKELKKISPSSKVIIATGYKSADIAQEAMRLGASDYIVKPFNRDNITKMVQKLS